MYLHIVYGVIAKTALFKCVFIKIQTISVLSNYLFLNQIFGLMSFVKSSFVLCYLISLYFVK